MYGKTAVVHAPASAEDVPYEVTVNVLSSSMKIVQYGKVK